MAISECFYDGGGLELQRLESRLTETVTSYSVDKDLPVLNIYDAFISNEIHEVLLKIKMAEAFEELGRSSIPVIKKEF